MLTYTAFLHLYPHPRRSMQTSAPVDADIRAGRCRHPRRSMQTSASVDADIRVGRCTTAQNLQQHYCTSDLK